MLLLKICQSMMFALMLFWTEKSFSWHAAYVHQIQAMPFSLYRQNNFLQILDDILAYLQIF